MEVSRLHATYMHGTLFLYPNNEDFRMTEEYKIIEEELEQDALMAEALKVVENIMVFICCSELIWCVKG